MRKIPPYLFAEIDRRVSAKRAAGVDVIGLDVGDPDLPTSERIVNALREAAADPANHRYASYAGLPQLRQAIAGWYEGRFGVDLDPETEILPTLGSKDGIVHAPLAFVDPGDVVLVPSPGYPVYDTGAILAGAEPYAMPLRAADGWLPDLDAVPAEVARRAKLMWLNYPNNPTGAVGGIDFLRRAVAFCRRNEIVLCHDAPYSEISFGGYRAPSVLEVEGARELAIEFHSVSKTFNMTGWRLGWVCGRADLVGAVAQLKTNLDSGIFQVVQRAAIAALTGGDADTRAACEVFHRRLRRVVEVLNGRGWELEVPQATFYVWAPVPGGETSIGFASRVLDEAAVNVTPGAGFGAHGEGYFRISVTVPDERLEAALERLSRLTF
ncbi:MAG: LL-diaminopimelate aminotransferase [Candidatus Dormibacteraceae bacterium]